MRTLLVALLIALALALAPLADARPPATAAAQSPACAQCNDRGMIACKLCSTKVCKSEKGFLHCSFALQCGDCGGTRWRECTFCEHAPEIDLRLERNKLEAWRATRDAIDEHMGRKDMLHLESARFALVYDVPRSVVKGVNSTHEAAHVVLDRLETIHAEFLVDTGATPAELGAPTQVMLWGSEKDQEEASSKWTLERTSTIAKLMGKAPVLSICFGKGNVRNEADLEHALAHQVAHCELSNLHQGLWLGGKKSGWIDEGYAHLVEIRRTGSVEHWCSITDEAAGKLKLGRFEAEVLARTHDGKVTELAAMSGKDTVALSPEQRLFGWSYVDFLTRTHPGKLALVVKFLQQDKPTSEAIQLGVNRSIDDFQRDWVTWVKATYTSKKR
ncbi:MAG: hypothetical protein NTV21_16125 [Planctomycetota bacterium]|nr:hypothetical protein [Planctomycetota bacterium]